MDQEFSTLIQDGSLEPVKYVCTYACMYVCMYVCMYAHHLFQHSIYDFRYLINCWNYTSSVNKGNSNKFKIIFH